MRIIGHSGQAVRKLFRVRIPVTHTAKPPGIDMEHLKTEFSRVADHTAGECFVHLHSAPPAIVDKQRVLGIAPRTGIAQDVAHPRPEHVAESIESVTVGADEDGGCIEWIVRFKSRAKGSGFRIETN